MATAETGLTGYSYADLASMPEDNLRREIIDGELIVNPAPTTRHQRALMNLSRLFADYRDRHGGEAFFAPTDVYLSDVNVVEPDLLFVHADHVYRVEDPYVKGAPDLVIEVSSPSTRRLDVGRKRDLYARFGVPEYWFVDLDSDRVDVHNLTVDGYGPPQRFLPGDTLKSRVLPGLTVRVEEALGRRPQVR